MSKDLCVLMKNSNPETNSVGGTYFMGEGNRLKVNGKESSP